MKRITLKSSATLNGLNAQATAPALDALAKMLAEIELVGAAGTLNVNITVRGSLVCELPGRVVAAHSAIDDAFAEASEHETETDLNISSVREPKPAAEGEPRAAKGEKVAS